MDSYTIIMNAGYYTSIKYTSSIIVVHTRKTTTYYIHALLGRLEGVECQRMSDHIE